MPDYEELLETAHSSLAELQYKLGDLDNVYNEIVELKHEAQQIPGSFKQQYGEIKKLSNHYVALLGKATQTFLNENKSTIGDKLGELKTVSERLNDYSIELQKKTVGIQELVKRLESLDFTGHFNILQKKFIEKTSADLASELKKIEDKTILFGNKINNLHGEVNRLEQVDLNAGFTGLQELLSHILQSVNGVNTSITLISGSINNFQNDSITNFNKIGKSLVDHEQDIKELKAIEEKIENRTKEIGNLLNSTKDGIGEKLVLLSEKVNDGFKDLKVQSDNRFRTLCILIFTCSIVILYFIYKLRRH